MANDRLARKLRHRGASDVPINDGRLPKINAFVEQHHLADIDEISRSSAGSLAPHSIDLKGAFNRKALPASRKGSPGLDELVSFSGDDERTHADERYLPKQIANSGHVVRVISPARQ
ncbi:hypothetical protein IVA80_04520 [Bradyrhizobium sp. 139]|uniref:hypothetical protein n=1 Tax=Bradyrhizobium sp. 139 TaxID=2782616 RepID=UPI001FF91D3D|nr:hypothetical protein [Bradyrhizobium sp. 139]MCK1740157.1 hypothetical protein [Bradyrhizobium sp. 139]